jgi:hypothetical protein
MADKSDEENLNIPTNNQSENRSDEIIPTTDTDSITQNQEIENMEVHHHPHVEKKNFKEYFLEFLMIFLAVTMGFFAESLREHLNDKDRENQYMNSFYEDLSNDQTNLPFLINSIQYQQIFPADSLPGLLSNATITTPANNIYRFLRIITRQQSINAFVTSRTIEQLKNAGEMHLISNRQIADSIIDYYKNIAFVAELQQMLFAMKGELANTCRPLLNSFSYDEISDSSDHIVNPVAILYLRSTNPDVINDCLVEVSNIKGLSRGIKPLINQIINKAANIKQLIAAKYNIKQ